MRAAPRIVYLWNAQANWTPEQLAEARADNREITGCLRRRGFQVDQLCVFDSVQKQLGKRIYDPDKSLFFNWCEGYSHRFSSAADVVQEIESLGYRHIGAAGTALRVAENKERIRQVLAAWDLPYPRGRIVDSSSNIDWDTYPAIVKPLSQHASIGISRRSLVENARQLKRQVEFLRELFREPVLVEEYLEGPELSVTVLGNTAPQPLPPVQLVYSSSAGWRDRIFSYRQKFGESDEPSSYACPAPLARAARKRVEVACLKAFRAFGCADCARFDIRLKDGMPILIDVNLNPDLYPSSLVAEAAHGAGITYCELLDQLVWLAVERQAE